MTTGERNQAVEVNSRIHLEMDEIEELRQGKNNVLLFPLPMQAVRREQEKVRCRERLGGLLKYYEREAA
jgi:hypothetical protein